MNLPDAATLFAVSEATWPAAKLTRNGQWTIRDGQAGGSRVSAATTEEPVGLADLARAETAMSALRQPLLFMVRNGQEALDEILANAGYRIKDPSILYAAPAALIAAQPLPPVTGFDVWPPLQEQLEIWAEGGIGPARIAVMERAPHPKTSLVGRENNSPVSTAFVGISGDCAMIHALEISRFARRQGHARKLTRAAAFWAFERAVPYLTLITTTANLAANALYTSLGFQVVGHYHYRIKEDCSLDQNPDGS